MITEHPASPAWRLCFGGFGLVLTDRGGTEVMITLPSGVADSLPKAWPRRLALPCSRQAIQYLRFGHLKYISRVDDCHAICLLSQCQCFRRSSQRGIANMAVQRSFAWQAWIPEHLRGAGTLAGRARGSLPASLSCGNINIKDLDAQKLSTYVCHEHGDFLRLKERVNLHHLRPYRVHSPYHSLRPNVSIVPSLLVSSSFTPLESIHRSSTP